VLLVVGDVMLVCYLLLACGWFVACWRVATLLLVVGVLV